MLDFSKTEYFSHSNLPIGLVCTIEYGPDLLQCVPKKPIPEKKMSMFKLQIVKLVHDIYLTTGMLECATSDNGCSNSSFIKMYYIYHKVMFEDVTGCSTVALLGMYVIGKKVEDERVCPTFAMKISRDFSLKLTR